MRCVGSSGLVHGLSDHSAMSVHRLWIELTVDVDADCVVVLAEHWAEACIAERHVDVTEQQGPSRLPCG